MLRRKRRKRSPEELIEDVLNVLHIEKRNGGPGYTTEDKRFARDVAIKLRLKKPLSDLELSTLRRLWKRI